MDGASLVILEGIQRYFCKKSESPSTDGNTLAVSGVSPYNTVELFLPFQAVPFPPHNCTGSGGDLPTALALFSAAYLHIPRVWDDLT
jgi:hypothetical protein